MPSNAFLVASRAIPLRTASSLKRLANDDPCIGDLELADAGGSLGKSADRRSGR